MYVNELGFNILRMEFHPSALMGPGGNLASAVSLDDDVATNVGKFDFNNNRVKLYGDFANYLQTNALEPEKVLLTGAFGHRRTG